MYAIKIALLTDFDAAKIISYLTASEQGTIYRTEEQMLHIFRNGCSVLAYDHDKVIGHIGITHDDPSYGIEIGAFVIDPQYRGRGIGEKLLRKLLEIIKEKNPHDGRKVFAFVNEQSDSLFQKIGARLQNGNLSQELKEDCRNCRYRNDDIKSPTFHCCNRQYDLSHLV